MKYSQLIFILFFSVSTSGQISEFIHIDQFGYLRDSDKVAVLSNPEEGFNGDKSYTPGSTMEVRKAENDEVVFSATITEWNAGNIHNQSGDRGWWFDFGGVIQSGTYYIHDPSTGESSAQFKIGKDIYDSVLQAAFKIFYYNRCNAPKESPYADIRWADGNNFLNEQQDDNCRDVYRKNDASTSRDLSGGWFDAGDYNKYVTFAYDAIHNLLWAYQENSEVFTDDWNIPESGNGIPDILDEIKWELDWLIKMNNDDGSTLIKMGSQDHNDNISAPPSLNTDPRYYGPTCSSASIALASIFAHAAKVFRDYPSMMPFADELQARAISAWDYAKTFDDNNSLQIDCDDGSVISGDADWDAEKQKDNLLAGAIYLLDLTGESKYNEFIAARYQSAEQLTNRFWGPYKMPLNDALLLYSTLSIATSTVATDIFNSFGGDVQNNGNGYYGFSFDDLYRASIPDWSYHWGSNQPKANYGVLNMLVRKYGIDPANDDSYGDYQRDVVHYFHGVNPLGIVYLSNMYELGGDRCANEIYHTWFADNSVWDSAVDSEFGPPPGYVPGGPNKDFSLSSFSPPFGQPPQKSYLDFNNGWPDNSWEITEPAIYYQAAYIRLLSGIMSVNNSTTSNSNLATIDAAIKVFPNPAIDQVTINGEIIGHKLQLLNADGAVVRSQQINTASIDVHLKDMIPGVYYLQLINAGNQIVTFEKLIKL